MSIKSLLALFLLFTAPALLAQEKKFQQGDSERFFRFGAKGGVNINKISGQSYKSGFNYNYQLGGFLQFNFSNRFGLQPEVNFVQSSSEFSNDATDVYDDLFRSGSQKNAKLNYLEIPLLLNINVGESKHIKLQFGPAYGVRLSESVDSLVNNIDIYKGGDWSAIGGLWIQLPVVHLGARYKYGLTNINSVDNREKWRAQAIQIFLGITI
ncbi:MAG TPA: porin family protein [Ferruginibacter sp.]|nr:porin family protein [Ferruginibacter sp.]HPH91527.1 porin family protein [Ferruginibacter sp.]